MTIEEILEQAEQYQQQKIAFVESIPTDATAVEIHNEYQKKAIIHPCTYDDYEWQASFFDALGAYADAKRHSLKETLAECWERGFRTIVEVLA